MLNNLLFFQAQPLKIFTFNQEPWFFGLSWRGIMIHFLLFIDVLIVLDVKHSSLHLFYCLLLFKLCLLKQRILFDPVVNNHEFSFGLSNHIILQRE